MMFSSQASRSNLVPWREIKWLHVVFDLNGILCRCIERRFVKGVSNKSELYIYDPTCPTIVGPKGVYTRPGVREFLGAVSQFANIVIWSSMLDGTARQVCAWLFDGLPPPHLVLGQKACGRILVALKLDLTYPDNFEKKIFLKTLRSALFSQEDGRYTIDNTVLIDDNTEKSILNYRGNAIFIDSWTTDENDSYLNSELGPWLRALSSICNNGSLRNYVDRNRIGRSPLSKDSSLFGHITRGMSLSTKNTGLEYHFPE